MCYRAVKFGGVNSTDQQKECTHPLQLVSAVPTQRGCYAVYQQGVGKVYERRLNVPGQWCWNSG